MLERTNTSGANAPVLNNGTLGDPVASKRAAIRKIINLATFAPSDEHTRQRKKDLAGRLWNESFPAQGTLVERYLMTRGIVFNGDLPEDLRFHPNLLHEPSRQYHPAMIALVRDIDGQFAGIHRTYLALDGSGQAEAQVAGLVSAVGELKTKVDGIDARLDQLDRLANRWKGGFAVILGLGALAGFVLDNLFRWLSSRG